MTFIILAALLFTKHLVFDFLYQPPYQWQNKGTYGHWGGLVHAAQHGIATWLILLLYNPFHLSGPQIWLLALAETLIHYHMDWFKMWLNKRKGWTATTHNEFWILTGVDQYVHSMTYVGILGVIYVLV